jgi:hypothetical protein
VADARASQDEHETEQRHAHGDRDDRQVLGVGDGDHGEGHRVVDDDQGEQEGACPRCGAPDESEDSKREGGVGAHGDAPPADGRLPGVHCEVDECGHGHATHGGEHRRGHAAPLS